MSKILSKEEKKEQIRKEGGRDNLIGSMNLFRKWNDKNKEVFDGEFARLDCIGNYIKKKITRVQEKLEDLQYKIIVKKENN